MPEKIKIGVIFFLPTLLILPALHYNPTPGLPGFLSLSSLFLFFVTAKIIFDKFLCSGFAVKRLNKLDKILLFFAIIHILILPYSIEPKVSLRIIFELLVSLCFYYSLSKSNSITRQWLHGLPIAVLFASILAIIQFSMDNSWPMLKYMNEVTEMERLAFGDEVPAKAIGPFLHGNSLAIFLTLTLPVVLGMALYQKNKSLKCILLLVFLFGILAQIVSFSRGGNISLFMALIFMWLFTKQKRDSLITTSKSKYYFVLFGTALIILCNSLGMTNAIKDRFFSMTFSKRDSDSNLSRVVNLSAGIKAVSANPLVGIGPGMSGKYYVNFGGWTDLGPHNLYLFIASERGLPALLSFLAAIFLVIRTVSKTFKNKGDWLVGGILSAVVAGLLNGLFESVLTDVFLPFFFANMGILMMFVNRSRQDSRAVG